MVPLQQRRIKASTGHRKEKKTKRRRKNTEKRRRRNAQRKSRIRRPRRRQRRLRKKRRRRQRSGDREVEAKGEVLAVAVKAKGVLKVLRLKRISLHLSGERRGESTGVIADRTVKRAEEVPVVVDPIAALARGNGAAPEADAQSGGDLRAEVTAKRSERRRGRRRRRRGRRRGPSARAGLGAIEWSASL